MKLTILTILATAGVTATGQTLAAQDLTLSGKGTSDSTVAGDGGTTLATKDYVDSLTGSLPNALTPGAFILGNSFDGSSAVTFDIDGSAANEASKVVVRDTSGNFSAGTITAALDGNASTATTAVNCGRSVLTGDGLDGGGELNADLTIQVDATVLRTSGTQTLDGTFIVSGSIVPTNTDTGSLGTSDKRWGDLYLDQSAIYIGDAVLTGSGTNLAVGGSEVVVAASPTFTGTASMADGGSFAWKELTANGENFMAFKAPDAVTASVTLTLPDGDGTAGQYLQTDGAGNLTWVDTDDGTY